MCIVSEIQHKSHYWGIFVENKHERYQKAMNIIDVLEGSQFAKIMQKGVNVE